MTQLNLIQLFDVIVDSNDINQSKPDPEVFLKAQTLLGLEKQMCLVIEDADSGLETANQVEIDVIYFGSGVKETAVTQIQVLADLVTFLA